MKEAQAVQIIRILEDLRKLAILNLMDQGYSQSRVADVLGVSQPTVSRMFPAATKNKSSSRGNKGDSDIN